MTTFGPSSGPCRFDILWTTQALADMQHWVDGHDRKRIDRIKALVSAIEIDPFEGIGRPERLRGNLAGCWSRRIDREHRLVYQVVGEESAVHILAARFHYGK